jgi:hypothetical protein
VGWCCSDREPKENVKITYKRIMADEWKERVDSIIENTRLSKDNKEYLIGYIKLLEDKLDNQELLYRAEIGAMANVMELHYLKESLALLTGMALMQSMPESILGTQHLEALQKVITKLQANYND